MLANAFIGKPEAPTDADLATALGSAKARWDGLLAELDGELGVNVHEWKSYSRKWGWSFRAARKARTIVWLAPHAGGFGVMFILGAKAVEAVKASKLPARLLRLLAKAPKYPEGTGLRFEIKSPRDLAAVKQLAAIKLAN